MTEREPPNPKKSETFQVRLPHALKEDFLNTCRRRGVAASAVVREQIESWLERERATAPAKDNLLMLIPRPLRKRRYLAGAAGAIGVAMFAVLPSAAEPDLKAAFQRMDLNGDGVVTATEFFAGQLPPGVVTEARQSLRENKPDAQATAFRVVNEAYVSLHPRPEGDPRGEWALSMDVAWRIENPPEDFDPATFDPMQHIDIDPRAVIFVDIDADADDAISFAEFETRFHALLAKNFARQDRNGDGYLDQPDFERMSGWVSVPAADGTMAPISKELLKTGFAKLDADSDGRISVAEYMAK